MDPHAWTGAEAWKLIVVQMAEANKRPEVRRIAEESLNGWFECVEGILRSGGKIRAFR